MRFVAFFSGLLLNTYVSEQVNSDVDSESVQAKFI